MNANPQLIVKKWGGENAGEFDKNISSIQKDSQKNLQQAIVVSAIRSEDFNTTDKLVEIGELLKTKENINQIYKIIDEIENFHISILEQKLSHNTKKIRTIIQAYFDDFRNNISMRFNQESKEFPSKNNDYSININGNSFSILGFGELLSAILQENILVENGLKARVLDLDGVVNLDKLDDQNLFYSLSKKISERVLNILDVGEIPVVPGYIPGFPNGVEKSIGRGYSDATASFISVGVSNSRGLDVVLEIQKSVIGVLSADPRIVSDGSTKLIPHLDYLTAKEITGARGAQAKLLHPQVLRKELQEADIKVKLFDPFGDSPGTIISKSKNPNASGIEFVGGRKNVVFFSISSGKMSETGILSSVFDIVKDYASVDIISTSETEISFTIDNGLSQQKLEEMANKIRQALAIEEDGYENFVKYQKNKALVFCVGQNLEKLNGIFGNAVAALSQNNINIEIISQGLMKRAIIFGLDSKDLESSISVLHQKFIAQK